MCLRATRVRRASDVLHVTRSVRWTHYVWGTGTCTVRNPFEQGVAYNVSLYDGDTRNVHVDVTYVGQLDGEYVFRLAPGTPGGMLLAVFPTDIARASTAWVQGRMGGTVVPVHRRECSKRGDPSTRGSGHVCNTEYERARWAS